MEAHFSNTSSRIEKHKVTSLNVISLVHNNCRYKVIDFNLFNVKQTFCGAKKLQHVCAKLPV